MSNWIRREAVFAILDKYRGEHNSDYAEDLMLFRKFSGMREEIEKLFSFPDPNPDWQHNDRNVMGQTEEEFWEAVDAIQSGNRDPL